MRAELAGLAAVALVLSACGGGGGGGGSADAPAPRAVNPASGYSGSSTSVTITGDGFLARPTGAGDEVDTHHRAWLGTTELTQVTWIDAHTLHATVPAGLSAGVKALRVENAFGKQGTLPAAFTVFDLPAGLAATASVGRTTVDTGQPVPVTLSVANGGTAAARVTAVRPTMAGTATGVTCTAPTPAPPQDVGAQSSRDFTWTCTATGAGTLTLGGDVDGRDTVTGGTLAASSEQAAVAVEAPAALTARVAVQGGVSAVSLGQSVTVVLSVTNTGGASATIGEPPLAVATGGSCGAPTPPPPVALPGGETVTFSWTCAPVAVGTLSLGGSVVASDDNTGVTTPRAAASPVTLPVQNPASLVGVTLINPSTASTTVNVGQPVGVSFRLVNGGAAAARLNAVGPIVGPGSTGTAVCSNVRVGAPPQIPAFPITLAGGSASVVFTWTCTPGASGDLELTGAVDAADANSGAALPVVPVALQVKAQVPSAVSVPVPVDAVPVTVDAGMSGHSAQKSTITIALRNAGGAGASITVVPTAAPAAGVTCGPTPAPNQTLAAGASTSLQWTCSATTAGTRAYGATVTVVDVNSGPAPSPAVTPASVAVQRPASLSAAFLAHAATIDTDQPLALTVRVTNSGEAAADVAGVAPSPAAGLTCSSAGGGAAVRIAGGGSQDFTVSCQAAAAGGYAVGAVVNGADVNDGADASATAAATSVTVQAPAGLTAGAVTAGNATRSVNQATHVTLRLTNAGGGTAHVASVTPTLTGTAGSCTPQTLGPVDLPGAAFHDFAWDCTGTAAGTATLDATVTATDANTGAAIAVNPAVDTVDIQALATLSVGAVTVTDTVRGVGQSTHVTLRLAHASGATAHVASVVPNITGVAGSCTPQTLGPVDLSGSASQDFAWDCTGTEVGTAILDATVTATDANTGAAIAVNPTADSVVVQALGSLTAGAVTAGNATRSVGQATHVTLRLTHAGGATAHVASVVPSMTSGSCLPVSLGPVDLSGTAFQDFAWDCTGSVPGTATLDAVVTATDANTGAAIAVNPTADSVVVQALGSLTAGAVTAGNATRSVGQSTHVTLRLTHAGGATAHVASVVPSMTSGSCLPASLGPVDLSGTAFQDFAWDCTGSVSGTATLDAVVTATDANTGAAIAVNPTADTVDVQALASVTAGSVTAGDPTRSVGQSTHVTLRLTHAGGATAHVASVVPSMTGGTCLPASLGPVDLSGTAFQDFAWDCTGSVPGTATLDAVVTATDANTGAAIAVNPAADTVAVQANAVLVAAFEVPPPGTVTGIPAAVDVQVRVTNVGGALAHLTAVVPLAVDVIGAGVLQCPGAPAQALPVDLAASESRVFTWTCDAVAGGTANVGAEASGTDANDASPLDAQVAVVPVEVVP